MQSNSFFDDVKKELECPVCQEHFSEINEPKILKCLHTFCKTCLEAWVRQHREGQLSCPTCRLITECSNSDINSLPSNLFYKQMVEIVEAYSGQGEEDLTHCGSCDEKKALKFYCFECNGFLCDDCVGVHRKGKIFSGHHVKDVTNFQSCDVQDYARRTNYCTVHIDEMRFFCENCKRCICRDCAILEHQDHNKISLDQGLENIKSEIDIRVHEAQENGSRLRSYKVSLEKRRMKVNGSIEEATKEVKRVAELCISLIRQHETSVTEQLIKQKQAFKDAFDKQMIMLDGKLMEIDSTLAFSEEILFRNNLPEILNVKAVLEEKLREVSVPLQPLEAMPKLGYSEVKYMQNDVFLNDAPGKLVTSDTEPLLSVAEGKNLTEGLVDADGTFTVTTKNAQGQTSYCAIDEVIAKINSLSGHETVQTVVTDLKDGCYSVSYKPKTPGKFTVSVEVAENPIMGSPFTLEVKNQPDISKQEKCPICLDHMTGPRRLKCRHVFCSVCLQTALEVNNRCPVCQEPQGVLRGNQPRGEMTSYYESFRSLPGYPGCGTIIIRYYFPSGVQGPEHPNPGHHYESTAREAYLPGNREGHEVLQLLKRAFDARMVFTVGTSNTTGRPNQVVWNDIHHKTSTTGGPTGFGYPDPDYLRRVKEELAAKGIR